MRVVGNPAQVSYRNTFKPQSRATGFADVMSSMASSDARVPAESHAKVQKEQDVSADERTTSRNILGVNWSDETLAVLIGNGGTIPIDTTKTINWDSKGGKELTDEQISELKGKYDVDNLSAQDFYDLMSDLTHMEVLSAEDCAGMYLATASSGASLSPGGSLFAGRTSGFMSGNIMQALSSALDSMLENMDWLDSDKYDKSNPFGANVKYEYKVGLERDIQTRQNVLQILQKLK